MYVAQRPVTKDKLFVCYNPIGSHKCRSCSFTARENTDKVKHFCETCDEAKFERCLHCKMGSFSSWWLHFHKGRCIPIAKHKTANDPVPRDSQEWFHCDQCTYKTPDQECLKRHKQSRHILSELHLWYECDQCAFKSQYKGTLNRHKNIKHTSNEWFKCDQCAFETPANEYLKRHIYLKHTAAELQKWFYCTECSYKTLRGDYVNKHIEKRHKVQKVEKWLFCKQCLFQTTQKQELSNHRKREHVKIKVEKWYECLNCLFKTKNKAKLQRHKNVEHKLDARFKCNQCTFATTANAFLNIHMKTKHTKAYLLFQSILKSPEEKCKESKSDEKWYECGYCVLRTRHKGTLNRHISVKHSLTIPIQCSQCSFVTSTIEYLKRHTKRTHSELETLYGCGECQFKTKHKSYMAMHRMRKHFK